MDADRARTFLLTLPHAVETEQWGGLVFWVADKALGGKMFTMLNLDSTNHQPIAYAAGRERYHELLENEGLMPAPYLARAHWVAATSWSAHRDRDWQAELAAAHALVAAKLSPKITRILSLPKAEQRRLLAEQRKLLAAQKIKTKAQRGSK